MDITKASTGWIAASQAWKQFAEVNPILGLKGTYWEFNNFLRTAREPMLAADAIRKARGRFWIAHVERFPAAAFDLLTGYVPSVAWADGGVSHHDEGAA